MFGCVQGLEGFLQDQAQKVPRDDKTRSGFGRCWAHEFDGILQELQNSGVATVFCTLELH